jgi:WD40 repeat protein
MVKKAMLLTTLVPLLLMHAATTDPPKADEDQSKCLLTFDASTAPLLGVQFSPEGKWLATASGGRVVLWDAATGKKVRTLDEASGPGQRGVWWGATDAAGG